MDFQINPQIVASGLAPDLSATVSAMAEGRVSAPALMSQSLALLDSPANAHAFIRRFDGQARAAAQAVALCQVSGAPLPPLAGLAVSVKDLFDVAGQPTTGGSRALSDAPRAQADCPAVARLRAAGAALIGHSNLSEFGYSAVGLNPHFNTPVNPAALCVNSTPRIPGGSTSGGAVSVATGAAFAALGSDTGGSIRIPAALQGLVGFKSTQRLVPRDGAIPLSPTLDTCCAITRSVRDAVLVHGVLASRTPRPTARPLPGLRLAVAQTVMLDGLDAEVARAFEQALARLRDQGALVEELRLAPLSELAGLQAQGGFAAAESWAWHRDRLTERGTEYDPRVAQRIRRGQAMGAGEYIDLLEARRRWITVVDEALAGFDVVLSPTVPMVAPALAPLLSNDNRFFAINALLLRNPSVVNMLDGCALTLPCHASGQLPVGLMLWAPAMHDDRLLGAALAIEAALVPLRGEGWQA